MRTKKNTYNYRLLAIWEKKSEEEKVHDKEFEKKIKKNLDRVLERIRATEKNGMVYVNGFGRVKSF